MLKIALAQINPCVGDFAGNTEKIISSLDAARQKKADIVVFPELALCGCPPEDLLLKKHFVDKNRQYLKKIIPHTKGLLALVGFVEREKDCLYNACAVVSDCRLEDVYRKVHLPNYGVFDEKRYFSPGKEIKIYEYKGHFFCLTICEDVWVDSYVSCLKDQSLDLVINISASPFHLGKIAIREKRLSSLAGETGTFVCYCNLAGGQDDLVFDGTSKVFSPQGKLIGQARRFQEDMTVFSLNRKKKYKTERIRVKEEEETFQALSLGLYDYVRKNNFKKVVVGVSGGIDSAVVVALAALTLGPDNVKAVLMPSRFTSRETLYDAGKVCSNLGVEYYQVSIENAFNAFQEMLKPWLSSGAKDKTEENLQARVRGDILMAFSNKFGYLVLNTGNKSEFSCGYCTLYGDMVGGFGLLKDVYKTLVYKLARQINRKAGKRVIPLSTIKRPPSAELRPNQRDSDTLPLYDQLDPILKLYIEEDLSLEQIVKKGFKREVVKKVIGMVDANEYKRRQAAIGIKITPKAFGKDRRMPITSKFSL